MTKETRGICFHPGLQTHSKPSAAVVEAMHAPSPQFTTEHAAPVKPHSQNKSDLRETQTHMFFYAQHCKTYCSTKHRVHTYLGESVATLGK